MSNTLETSYCHHCVICVSSFHPEMCHSLPLLQRIKPPSLSSSANSSGSRTILSISSGLSLPLSAVIVIASLFVCLFVCLLRFPQVVMTSEGPSDESSENSLHSRCLGRPLEHNTTTLFSIAWRDHS
jgi:hypothetical protein